MDILRRVSFRILNSSKYGSIQSRSVSFGYSARSINKTYATCGVIVGVGAVYFSVKKWRQTYTVHAFKPRKVRLA